MAVSVCTIHSEDPCTLPAVAGMEDALSAAVNLLADIEGQIKTASGLSPSANLSLADTEQLHKVPPSLLESLESTVSLVQELRDQLSIVQLNEHSCSDYGQAELSPESSSPSSPSGRTSSPPVATRCASPQPAARSARARLHSAGPRRAANQQHGRAAVYSSAPQPFSTHSATKPSIAAARSALFRRDAPEDAVSDWHQSKVQQQQEAALAHERLMDREEQQLSSLAAAEEAAHTAHQQRGCTGQRAGQSASSRQSLTCHAALWSRRPDEWDMQCEQEENARRHNRQQLTLAQQASEEAAWRQQVDQVHQQLLDQQKHKAALRQRLQQDAQRAKREQLRRIEPVAKARARANGLASLGLDPEIMALSEKFGRLSGLVDEVQQRMEAEYGIMGSMDDQAAYGRLSPSPTATVAVAQRSNLPANRLSAGQQQQQRLQQPPQVQHPTQTWPVQQQQRAAGWRGPRQQAVKQIPLQQQQHYNSRPHMPNGAYGGAAAPSSAQQQPLQASRMRRQPAQQPQQPWQQQPVMQPMPQAAD